MKSYTAALLGTVNSITSFNQLLSFQVINEEYRAIEKAEAGRVQKQKKQLCHPLNVKVVAVFRASSWRFHHTS